MNSCFLNVLLDTCNDAGGLVSQGIDIELCGLLEELIDQHWTIRSKADSSAHIPLKRIFVVNDRHRSTTQHITGTDQDGITDTRGNFSRLSSRGRHSVVRLRYAQFFQQCAKTFPV